MYVRVYVCVYVGTAGGGKSAGDPRSRLLTYTTFHDDLEFALSDAHFFARLLASTVSSVVRAKYM
jgi:hypothetical protein